MAYEEGKGSRKNKQLAIKHYRIAARAGSKPAQKFLNAMKSSRI
jgi:TPR repeat protein